MEVPLSKPVAVYIPLINPNEPEANLAAVHVRPGQYMQTGDPLCTLETTKAAADLVAEAAGYVIGLQAAEGQTLAAGALFCYLAEAPDTSPPSTATDTGGAAHDKGKLDANETHPPVDLRITQPALALARQLKLDLEQLPRQHLVTESWLRSQYSTASSPAHLEALAGDFDPENAIIVYGGGGHGKALIDLLRSLDAYHILGIVDDGIPAGDLVMGLPVLGGHDLLAELAARGVHLAVNAVGGIGNLGVRARVFAGLQQAGFSCPALVHPTAFVESSASLSEGVQVFPHAYVGSEAHLGYGVIVNTGAVVSHDCRLEEIVNISPGALLAGEVSIGARALVGMGVTINLRVHIGSGARIGNSAVIKGDVPDNAIVRAGAVWPA